MSINKSKKIKVSNILTKVFVLCYYLNIEFSKKKYYKNLKFGGNRKFPP